MRTDAPRPRRAPVFSLPPCTAHSLFSQKREWGCIGPAPKGQLTTPRASASTGPRSANGAHPHPARQGEHQPPSQGGKENRPKPPGSGRITNPRYHLNFPCGTLVSPLTAGLRRGLLPPSAAPLRDDFPCRLGDALTNRVLSWPRQTGYCFPSLRLHGR